MQTKSGNRNQEVIQQVSTNTYQQKRTNKSKQLAKTGAKLCGAKPVPSTCGRTQMLRLHSLGQEIRAVFSVSAFPVLHPAPTERTVLAEHLVGNPPGRSSVMIDSGNEIDSITTFAFIRYAPLLPQLFEERHHSCEPGFLQALHANHFFTGHTINKCLSGNYLSMPWKAPQLSQILKA